MHQLKTSVLNDLLFRIPDIQLYFFQVQSLSRSFLWDNVFSHTHPFGFLSNVFRNDFVLEKQTGNSGGLHYINSPRFVACVLLEVFVYDFLRPTLGIGVEWDTSQWCRRWVSGFWGRGQIQENKNAKLQHVEHFSMQWYHGTMDGFRKKGFLHPF